jgi:hypothetical protein
MLTSDGVRDIDHNRAGQLAPAQADVLRKVRRARALIYMGLPVFGLYIGGAILAYGVDFRRSVALFILSSVAGLAVLAGTVAGALFAWRRASSLPHETVTSVDGRVVWAGAPLTWTPVRPSGVPFASRVVAPLLPPGPYRFYLHDDQIVGAESPLDDATAWSVTQSAPLLFMSDEASSVHPAPLPIGEPETFRAVLGQVIGFTAEDLAYHRRGTLSPRQGGGRVITVEGPLAVDYTMRSRRSVTYWWNVGGRRIEVPIAWLYAVPPGLHYRCYLDERTYRLVSLEPLGTAGPDRKEA